MRIKTLWNGHEPPSNDAESSEAWKWPVRAKYATLLSSRTSSSAAHPDEEWIHGVLLGTWAAGGISVLNILLALIAIGISYSQSANSHGFLSTELYNGNCTLSSRWATVIHVVINLLSTTLLEASNYAMQCVSGPSRTDVDKAHRKRSWLDIGVMSFRNFRAMSIKRKLLWLVLLLSSVPIHMIYNSVVFSSISALDYGTMLIPDDLTPTESLVGAGGRSAFVKAIGSTPELIQTEIFNGTFQNLSNAECVKKYDVEYNTHLGTLILVAERQYFGNSSSLQWGYSSVYDYVKAVGKSNVERLVDEGKWTAEGLEWTKRTIAVDNSEITISYCMEKTMTQRCRLLFSPSIALAVILFNLTKVVCMYLTAKTDRSEIFLRVGDAISSFLAHPDPTTKGRCLMSRADMARGPHQWEPLPRWKKSIRKRIRRDPEIQTDIPMENRRILEQAESSETAPRMLPRRKRWFRAASLCRWASIVFMFTVCFLISYLIYFDLIIEGDGWSLSEQWSLGFGSASSQTSIRFSGDNMIALVLLSNTPQLVFSIIYFTINSLLSCMLVTAEYNDYAIDRKPLRVSWPRGQQRSTYYLALPYRYSIPLFIMSVALHWLLSESFFYVNITVYDVFGHEDTNSSIKGCGFSPIAIFIITILEGVSFFSLLALGMKKFRSRMPIAAHCSAAISAACHPPHGDDDAELKAVAWGEVDCTDQFVQVDLDTGVDTRSMVEAGSGSVGGQGEGYAHCTFTSFDVTMPVKGRLYS
ncbi:hypothetical protein AtubIFM56815_003693 [Aspergillus tubingensis]|uniref:DUF6536 domain-containing protein n=1 Tax=Aspergillus tubingensis TaxID=5068 RepID=A0A9W6AVH9_ASPTU|nr:hypothetical protein AtubIFM56815_003693 [Aspergillus tubingensis]